MNNFFDLECEDCGKSGQCRKENLNSYPLDSRLFSVSDKENLELLPGIE
jgi:hypothetical protein